jgi:hypothetical protein
MDNCPPEILYNIFAYASLDDGFTGRSLSVVSKYIHQTSQPVRFQSIALRHHEQIMAFANIVERTPSNLRRVCHLFISTQDPEPKRALQKQFSAGIQRILRCVALTIKTLAIFVPYASCQSWCIAQLNVPLPNLTELTIHMSDPMDTPLVLFESLRYLNIRDCEYMSSGLEYISKVSPSLTHLRVDGMCFAHHLDIIPLTVTTVLIQPPPAPRPSKCGTHRYRYEDHMRRLQDQIELQNDARMVLLQAPSRSGVQELIKEAQQQWLERINGGQGCWIQNTP